jgi:hypothetical protein
MRRRIVIGICVLAVAALAAACDGGGDEESTTTTSSTSTSSTTSTTGASTTTTQPAVPICATSELAATISEPDAGAGQRNAFVTFTNNGSAPCTMFGYIGLQLLDGSGNQIPTDVVRTPGPENTVTLEPGGQAYTTIQWGVIASGNEPDDGPCEPNPAQIEITSPNATTSLVQPWNNGPVCAQGQFNTVPVLPGAPPPQP